MSPVQWAVGISLVAGVASRHGFGHAVGAALLLIMAIISWRIVHGGRRMREANGSGLAKRSDQRIAECAITSYAAVFRSEASRGAAFEASQDLAEMVGDGASRQQVHRHVRQFLFSLPGQILQREGSSPAPTIRLPRHMNRQSRQRRAAGEEGVREREQFGRLVDEYLADLAFMHDERTSTRRERATLTLSFLLMSVFHFVIVFRRKRS